MEDLTLWPVPSNGHLEVRCDTDEDLVVEVFTSTGALTSMQRIRNGRGTIDFGTRKGVMVIRFTYSQRTLVRRVVVN